MLVFLRPFSNECINTMTTCADQLSWMPLHRQTVRLVNDTSLLLMIQPEIPGHVVAPFQLPSNGSTGMGVNLMSGSGTSPACISTANIQVWLPGEETRGHVVIYAGSDSVHVTHLRNSVVQTSFDETTNTVTFTETGSPLTWVAIVSIVIMAIVILIPVVYVKVSKARHRRRVQRATTLINKYNLT